MAPQAGRSCRSMRRWAACEDRHGCTPQAGAGACTHLHRRRWRRPRYGPHGWPASAAGQARHVSLGRGRHPRWVLRLLHAPVRLPRKQPMAGTPPSNFACLARPQQRRRPVPRHAHLCQAEVSQADAPILIYQHVAAQVEERTQADWTVGRGPTRNKWFNCMGAAPRQAPACQAPRPASITALRCRCCGMCTASCTSRLLLVRPWKG